MTSAQPQSPRIHLEVSPTHQGSAAGDRAVFVIAIENRSDEAQSQTLTIDGLPAGWYTLDFDERRRSFPREQRNSTLLISIPENTPAQLHQFQVIVRAETEQSTVSCSLDVLQRAASSPTPEELTQQSQIPAPGLSMTPGSIVWQDEAQGSERLTLVVRNVGSQDATYSFTLEGLEAGWYTLIDRLIVPARQATEVDIEVHPPARARQGDHVFRVRAAVDGNADVFAEAAGRLTIQPFDRARTPAPPGTAAIPEAARPTASPALPPDVSLAPRPTFRFGPGEPPARAVVTIQNKSTLVEHYEIQIVGIEEDWYQLTPSEARLEPGGTTQVQLLLTPKAGPGFPAGDYPFRIRVAPRSFPDSFAEIGAVITIIGVAAFDARLTPVQTQGRKEKFKLTLVNTGAVQLNLWMDGSDPEGALKFKFPPPPTLDPGDEAVVPVWVGARRNGLVGRPETYDFRLRVLPAGGQSTSAKSFDARMVHQPFLSARFFALSLLLMLLVTTIGVILALGTSSVSNAATWVKCGMDDDFQQVRGGDVLIKTECGGADIPEQLGTNAVVPSVVPSATAAPGVTPTAAPACTPSGNVKVGDNVIVVRLTRIRANPGTGNQGVLQVLTVDKPGTITEGHRCADGLTWWKVKLDNVEGWAAERDENNTELIKKQ